MNEEEIEVPIYLITGFLESGKTSFLNFTLRQDYFQLEEPTLLINTEEGEETYDAKDLLKYHTLVENATEQEQFNVKLLRQYQRQHNPGRVVLEYNPFWSVASLEAMKLPDGWGIVQKIVIVDASTFQVYMNNMKSLFVEMVRNADMVLFNRSSADLPLANFRRSVKVVSPGCSVEFAGENNEPVDIFEDDVPYDITQDPIVIDDIDYGIFYVDMRDNPERYDGKLVRFRARVLKSSRTDADIFMPARPAMTCCAEDVQYIGYICHSKNARRLTEGSWIELTARVRWEYVDLAGEEEPVFYAKSIQAARAPEDEMVYFN